MNKLTVKAGLAVLAAMTASATMAQSGNIQVLLNGQPVAFNDTTPREINGRVLVPMRAIFEDLGAYVHWNDATQTVDATKGDKSIRLRIGDPYASVNGQNVTLDVPPRLIGGSTMVPLRFVSESLGADVNWQAMNNTVLITTADAMNNGQMTNSQTITTYNNLNYQDRRNWTQQQWREWRRNHPGDNNYPNDNTPVIVDNNQNQVNQEIRAERHALRAAIRANTVIPVTLQTPLSSETNQPGDAFTATVQTNGMDNYAGLPTGTTVEGHVIAARARGNNTPGVLQVAFDRLRTPNGVTVPIDGMLSSLDNNAVTRNADGTIQATSRVPNNQVPVFVGGGAGAGALIGMITKTNVLTDAVIGGALGYLFSQIKGNVQPNNVSLNPGTTMGVRLNQALNIQQ